MAAPTGFLGGVQAGYNWQREAFVLDVEADFGYLGLQGSTMRNLALQAAAPPPVCSNIRGCPVPAVQPVPSAASLHTDGGAYTTCAAASA